MLPLNKLQRFAKRAPQPAAPPAEPPPIEAATQGLRKLPPAPPLTKEQLIAMANPRSFACEHCKQKASEKLSVMYTETPSFKKWICINCWGHHARHGVLPPIAPPRALPVLLRKKS